MQKYPGNRLGAIFAMLALAALVGTVALFGPGQAAPAQAHEANIVAVCGVGEVLPTYVEEGNNYRVKVRRADGRLEGHIVGSWYTVAGSADASDYQDMQGVFQEAEGRVVRDFPTTEDEYAEDYEKFTIRFQNALEWGNHPECTFTIRNDDVGITGVRITSSPADGETYHLGETIEIALKYNELASVMGPAIVGFRLAGADGWRAARYHRGTRTKTLYFRYQVQPGDFDDDGISLDGGFIDENGTAHGTGGPIVPTMGVNVFGEFTPWWHGIGHQAGHKVDGSVFSTATEIISTPASGDTYGAGETIKVALTYNTPVDVEGDVRVSLRVGAGDWWRSAGYLEGTGTDRLVFGYEVRPGDLDADGISMDGGYVDENGTAHGYAGGGTIKAAGTDVLRTPRYPGLSHDTAHQVDGVAPTIRSIGFTNASGSDNTYGVGDNITVYVNFNEDVLTLGAPQLTLDFDGTEKTASYAPPPDAWHPITREYDPLPKPFAAFTYTVRVGDTDADGIAIAANALALNGGSIQDGTGNDADLRHDALAANAAHMVSAPGGL